jgi:hypothetical protein
MTLGARQIAVTVRLVVALTVAAGMLWAAAGAWAGAATVTCATPLDDFNRADGTDLGPKWTEQFADASLLGGQVTGDVALITFNGQAANEACVDVTANPTPEGKAGSVTLVLRYGNQDQNVFVKVQDSTGPVSPFGPDGNFDHAHFYRGLNGSTPWPGAIMSTDVTPFSTGRIHLAVSGTTVTLDIDNNSDGVVDQTFSSTNLPTAGLGVGIGLALGGGARADNFAMTDTLAPQTLKDGKKLNRAKGKGMFRFSSDDSGASFQCRLDKESFKRCTSPRRLKNLERGKHKFQVRAVDRVGNIDAGPIIWSFRI